MTELKTVSREPGDYTPSDHFCNRVRKRKIPGPAIAECIQNGDVEPGDDTETVKFVGKYGGVYYTLIANPTDRVAVTVYTNGR